MGISIEGLRQFPRIPYSCDVYLMDEAGFGFFLEALNLSQGGVFLKTSYLLNEGEPYSMRLSFPDGRTVSTTGHVCRTSLYSHTEEPNGIALAFDDMLAFEARTESGVTAQLNA